MFCSSPFLKLQVIWFSFSLRYIFLYGNARDNKISFPELYIVLFLKSICIENLLKTCSPRSNGTLIVTTFIKNSKNVLLGMRV